MNQLHDKCVLFFTFSEGKVAPESSSSAWFLEVCLSLLVHRPHPDRQRHTGISWPSHTDNIAAGWYTSTKKALEGWILGTVGWSQTQSVTNTSTNITSSWGWDLNSEEGWLLGGMNSILAPIIPHSLRCLWHFVNWPLVAARRGSPETAASNKNPQADTCEMWDEVIIFADHSSRLYTCQSHVINTEPGTDTSLLCEDILPH